MKKFYDIFKIVTDSIKSDKSKLALGFFSIGVTGIAGLSLGAIKIVMEDKNDTIEEKEDLEDISLRNCKTIQEEDNDED